MNINEIENPQFIKQLNTQELEALANDIRQFLLKNISKTGGHFSSNLGIVELTIAMHYVFDMPIDKFIFDVGHQAYVHKILTGRAKDFPTLRQYKGLSGFQKRSESKCDPWEAGHSSTAISAAIGMATARDIKKEDYHVVAVVGDAAIMSGESFEALNYLGYSNSKVIVILNDNNMSITKNVGGLSNFLSEIRVSSSYKKARDKYIKALSHGKLGNSIYHVTKKIKDKVKKNVLDESLFSHFGLDYIGPIDGHNIEELIRALKVIKNLDHSVLLHVETTKGKGYPLAEADKIGEYHGVPPFDLNEGLVKPIPSINKSWSEAVSNYLFHMMNLYEDIVTITPAMITGSCLNKIFEAFPDRSFDVGIAEEHAVTFTGGLSLAGTFPFLSIYSSFLQRGYDQLNHDIARMDIPCLIGIDRAGLVGSDGATHHGVFDISILTPLPNVIIMAPSNQHEMEQMMFTAYTNRDHPYFMRYSKNKIKFDENIEYHEIISIGKWKVRNNDLSNNQTIITYGDNYSSICTYLEEHPDIKINVVNALFIKPIDTELLDQLVDNKIYVYETDMLKGGLGSLICQYYANKQIQVTIKCYGIDEHYVGAGDIDCLLKVNHLTVEDIIKEIKEHQ